MKNFLEDNKELICECIKEYSINQLNNKNLPKEKLDKFTQVIDTYEFTEEELSKYWNYIEEEYFGFGKIRNLRNQANSRRFTQPGIAKQLDNRASTYRNRQLVAASVIASAAIAGASMIYKRGKTSNPRAAIRSAMSKLQGEMAGCSKTRNPDACKTRLSNKIKEYEIKLSNIKENVEHLEENKIVDVIDKHLGYNIKTKRNKVKTFKKDAEVLNRISDSHPGAKQLADKMINKSKVFEKRQKIAKGSAAAIVIAATIITAAAIIYKRRKNSNPKVATTLAINELKRGLYDCNKSNDTDMCKARIMNKIKEYKTNSKKLDENNIEEFLSELLVESIQDLDTLHEMKYSYDIISKGHTIDSDGVINATSNVVVKTKPVMSTRKKVGAAIAAALIIATAYKIVKDIKNREEFYITYLKELNGRKKMCRYSSEPDKCEAKVNEKIKIYEIKLKKLQQKKMNKGK